MIPGHGVPESSEKDPDVRLRMPDSHLSVARDSLPAESFSCVFAPRDNQVHPALQPGWPTHVSPGCPQASALPCHPSQPCAQLSGVRQMGQRVSCCQMHLLSPCPPKFPVALPQSQVRHLRSRCGTSLPSPAPHPAEPQAPGATLPVNVAVLKWRLGAGCQLWLYYREENNFQLNARRDGSIKVLATSSNEGTPTGRSLGRAFCCGLSSSGSDLDL